MEHCFMLGKWPRFCDSAGTCFLIFVVASIVRERNGTDFLPFWGGMPDFWARYSVSFGLGTEVGETIYTYIMGGVFMENGNVS